MNQRLFSFGVLLLLVTVMMPSPMAARGKKAKEPERVYTVIASVDAGSITVAEGKVMKTFAITRFTEILVKGQRAKLTDLVPGMSVSVTLSTDPKNAARINASDPPPETGKK